MSDFNFLRKLDVHLGRICNLLFRPKCCNNEVFYKKILLIKFWGLGNLTIIWPLVYKIKETYPNALIYFFTFDLNREFLERNKAISRLFYFKYTRNIFKIIAQLVYFAIKFKQDKIDVVINFETFNNASALFSYVTGAPLRIGINNKYEKIFYHYWIERNPEQHISQTFLNLLHPLRIESSYNYYNFVESKDDTLKVEHMLENFGVSKFICIHPGTSENFYGKRYRKDYFASLADLLLRNYQAHIIITGSGKEHRLAEDIIERISGSNRIINLAGALSVWEFIELLRKSILFISNDTGPVHLAASLGISIAALYGPTTPRRYGPLTENSLIFYRSISCSPCMGVNYINKDCTDNYKCLNFLPQEIFNKISEFSKSYKHTRLSPRF